MAEALKHLLDAGVARAMAMHLRRVHRSFDAAAFEAAALRGLDDLALKARAAQFCAALEATLPRDFDRAAGLLEAALGAPIPVDGVGAARDNASGLAGWAVWPLTLYIARNGRTEPERSLGALHAMTQRFTAEDAIRRFIEDHPAVTFETLARWTQDPIAHVRRLVSEGTRPRLPWSATLPALIADPAPNLPLLAALQDDPSEYVRRSVANHLNDIAKDHPALVADWLDLHLPGAPPARVALLRHASRTLVKAGDARVLAAWGLGRALHGDVTFGVAPQAIRLGDTLRLEVVLRSRARQPQRLVVDYVVHHVKADGRATNKVFKGWSLALAAGEERRLAKQHAVRPITTRRYHAGWHRVELQVNGKRVAEAGFDLRVD